MSLSTLRSKDHYKAVARELAEAGLEWREEVGGKHARLIIAVNGREEIEILSLSPSDYRAPMKARSHIRRRIKQWKAESAARLATDALSAQFPTLEKRTMNHSHMLVAASSSALTMSSREIAELCEKRHDHVLRDIKKTLEALKLDLPSFGGIYLDVYGREQSEYRLPQNLTMTLMTGYSIPLRQRVVDRWMELENKQAPSVQLDAILQDPAKLRALLLDNVEKVLVLEAELEEAKPLAAAYDHLTRADGTLCITDAAKTLQMRPKDLFSFLQSRKWIYRRPGNGHWVGYQDKLQQGLLDHRVNEVTASDGFSKITEQVRLTAKGLGHIAKMVVPV